MVTLVSNCRLCNSNDLVSVFKLGNLALSGFFPENTIINTPSTELELVKCNEGRNGCGLVQLKFQLELTEMYGDSYGYRSGLNPSMVEHLNSMYQYCLSFVDLNSGDLVIDIAGNDGTFLNFLPKSLDLLSIDPSAAKFSTFYSPEVRWNDSFFTYEAVRKISKKKAKLITSFSVLYDCENPLKFVEDISKLLDDESGIWVSEQSYLPSMLKQKSFDTICHEHLLYFSFKQLKFLIDAAGLKILDLDLTKTNGGSIRIVAAHKKHSISENTERIKAFDQKEEHFFSEFRWSKFQNQIHMVKIKLLALLENEIRKGYKLAGLGASTKGGILLQYFGIDNELIPMIGDVNPDKYSKYIAGTKIKIAPQDFVLDKYESFLVLPWHFKDFFISDKRFAGKRLIFPLPEPEIHIL